MKEFTEKCIQYGFDGIVLENQEGAPDAQNEFIRQIRKHDPERKLTLIAGGCQHQGVITGAEALGYLDSGADACQLYAKVFTDGPFASKTIEQDLVEMKKLKEQNKITLREFGGYGLTVGDEKTGYNYNVVDFPKDQLNPPLVNPSRKYSYEGRDQIDLESDE